MGKVWVTAYLVMIGTFLLFLTHKPITKMRPSIFRSICGKLNIAVAEPLDERISILQKFFKRGFTLYQQMKE